MSTNIPCIHMPFFIASFMRLLIRANSECILGLGNFRICWVNTHRSCILHSWLLKNALLCGERTFHIHSYVIPCTISTDVGINIHVHVQHTWCVQAINAPFILLLTSESINSLYQINCPVRTKFICSCVTVNCRNASVI